MDTQLAHEIEALFNKSFVLASSKENQKLMWKLPPCERIRTASTWTNNELLQLKSEMNAVKDQLSNIDIEKWSQHTASLNKAKNVVYRVRDEINPELCTQAWCKFYEVLCKYPLVPYWKKMTTFSSVHLCEAPGGFITSLNHYLGLNFPHIKLAWLASTLNPYYEGNILQATIQDDRLICSAFSQWCFGVDNTGNIFSKLNRDCLCHKASELGEIHMVTADGSVDCQNNPGEQENIVASLHIAEVVMALRLLVQDGSFVLKMFSFYEHTSVCLLYLLVCVFDQVHVFKPGTSSSGNSEVYVVALGYAGESFCGDVLNLIDKSIDQNMHDSKSLFFYEDIPLTFIDRVIECANFFKKLQTDTITENLRLFNAERQSFYKRRNKLKLAVASNFIFRYGLGSISREKSVIGAKLNAIERRQKPLSTGSFVDRTKIKESSLIDKLKFLELQYTVLLHSSTQVRELQATPIHSFNQIPIKVTFGKEFQRCLNSVFCEASLIIWYNQVVDCYKEICDVIDLVRLPKFTNTDCVIDLVMNWVAEKNIDNLVSYNTTCQSLVDNLNKKISASLKRTNTNCEKKTVVADLNGDEYMMFSYGAIFFNQILANACDIFKFLDLNDNLVMLLNPMLTRVEVGLLFVIFNSFEEVILRSSFDGLSKGMAFCMGFKGSVEDFHTLISERQKLNKSTCIVEIIDVIHLLDEPYFSKIIKFNNEFILRQTRYLLTFLNSVTSTTSGI